MEQQNSSQVIQRVNAKLTASSLIFKQLVDSLRRKNQQKRQHQDQQFNQSGCNPHNYVDEIRSQKPRQNASTFNHSSLIDNVFSQKNSYQITKQTPIKSGLSGVSNLNAIKKQMDNDQDIIRLKPKGSIDGRDVIKKKQIDKDSFQHKIPHFQDTMRNKIIRVPKSIRNQQQRSRINITARQYYNNEQYQAQSQPAIRDQNNTNKTSRNFSQNEVNQNLAIYSQRKSQALDPPRVNFTQNKFNRAVAQAKKVKDIDQSMIAKFYHENAKLTQNSQAKDIFAFFSKLCQMAQVLIYNPHIKKYRNCAYYGNQIMLNQRYEGFLYFFDSRIYFGDLLRGHKDGNGVEINFKDNSIWRGYFVDGQKTGKFQVKRGDQTYLGQLKNGVYDGRGKLITKQSIYQGIFQNGYKQGYGQQVFPKSGLKLKGNFYQGIFQAEQVTTRIQAKHYFSKPQFHNPQKLQPIREYSIGQQTDLPHPKFLPRHTSQGFQQKSSRKHSNPYYEQASFPERKRNEKPTFSKNRFADTKKSLFNHEKLMRISPSPQEKLPQKVSNKGSNLMQFEYSFDASSAQNTITSKSSFNPFRHENINIEKTQKNKQKGNQLKGIRFRRRIQSSQFQQPLPAHCFYKS